MKQEIIWLKKKSNELMSKKHKRVHRVLKYIEHLLILFSTVIAWLVGITIGITSSAIGLKISVLTTGIKNYWCN